MTTYGQRADHVSAYTYGAEIVCPRCAWQALAGAYTAQVDRIDPYLLESGDTETLITELALFVGVDYDDPATYDSGAYPKPVFSCELEEGEVCDCGADLY